MAARAMAHALVGAAHVYWKDFAQAEALAQPIAQGAPSPEAVRRILQTWAEHSDKPLIVFLDELDALL
ncbi:MAG: hypothetical protein OHK0048_22060 [Rhodoferax sp.]